MQLSPKEFEYQFRCLYRPLNMYALRYTENLDDAEDIVQQAFSDVWEKLVGGTSIQNLKAYMYQTVRNRSLTLITNRQTHCETTELGISIKTVEHQISKALKTLRETAIKIYTFFFG